MNYTYSPNLKHLMTSFNRSGYCYYQYMDHICPTKLKRSICISDVMQDTLFYLERFLKKLANDYYSSITKDIIYHIKHNVHYILLPQLRI